MRVRVRVILVIIGYYIGGLIYKLSLLEGQCR